MFVIDVQGGGEFIEIICMAIKDLIENDLVLGGQRTSICVITYD